MQSRGRRPGRIFGWHKGARIAAIGITNQRETTVLWDRATGEALAPAIVWQDRRTAEFCETLKVAGHEAFIREKTGLVLDAYFSGTKLKWLLDHVPEARQRAAREIWHSARSIAGSYSN